MRVQVLVLFGLHTSPCSDICSLSLHRLPHHHVRLWCHLAGGIFGIVSSLWAGLEFLKAWSWGVFIFCFLWLFPVEVGHCSGTTLGPIHVSGEVWAWENSERQTGLGWQSPGDQVPHGALIFFTPPCWAWNWSWSLQKTSVGSLNPHVVQLAGSPAGHFVFVAGTPSAMWAECPGSRF